MTDPSLIPGLNLSLIIITKVRAAIISQTLDYREKTAAIKTLDAIAAGIAEAKEQANGHKSRT